MSLPQSAMILAAGRGERMRPLTDQCPKPLLEAGGKPLIEYHLERLASAGFARVVINLGWEGERIRRHLGDGAGFGLEILYSEEGWPALETGGGIVRALPYFEPGPFLVINGDVWTDCPLTGLGLGPEDLAHLVVVDNPAHRPEGDFFLNSGRLDATHGDPVTFAGIGVYRPKLFRERDDAVRKQAFALAPLLHEAIAAGKVVASFHSGAWCDVGTPERLRELDGCLKAADHSGAASVRRD